MLAAVFIMQSIGQLVATLVGLGVLEGLRNNTHFDTAGDDELTRRTIDSMWRYVAGVGAIPALVAILFRLTIPESGRYTLDVQNESKRALEETRGHYGIVSEVELGEVDAMDDVDVNSVHGSEASSETGDTPYEALPVQFSIQDMRQYFLIEGNWRYLAGTSVTWFLLDFAFYGSVGCRFSRSNVLTASQTGYQQPSDPCQALAVQTHHKRSGYAAPSLESRRIEG